MSTVLARQPNYILDPGLNCYLLEDSGLYLDLDWLLIETPCRLGVNYIYPGCVCGGGSTGEATLESVLKLW